MAFSSSHWGQQDVVLTTHKKWQNIVDMLAESLCAQSCIITQQVDNSLMVMAASQNLGNNYARGDAIPVHSSLFCCKVIKHNEPLYVELDNENIDGSKEDSQKTLSYCGHPVHKPDGQIFGTICVMDAHPHHNKDQVNAVVNSTCKLIETDLLLNEHLDEVSEAALTDELTGLLNRRGFFLFAQQQVNLASRYKKYIGLIFLDINDLKKINDDYGHKVGDKAIQAYGKNIRECLRSCDLAARLGGDEFVVLLFINNETELLAINERLRKSIEAQTLNLNISIKASTGTTFASYESDICLADLIEDADRDMYAMKKSKHR